MKKCVVSCVQMYIRPLDVDGNTERALYFLNKAKKEHKSDLVVFQESVTTGFTPNMSEKAFLKVIDKVPGKQIAPILDAAKKMKLHIIWPAYEKIGQKIFNSAFLIGSSGKIIGKYCKTHPFDRESTERGGWTTPGAEMRVFQTPFAKIGMIICFDGDYPEASRLLAKKGAEIIARPSALLRNYEIWSLTNRARAFDNHVFLAAANATGFDAAGRHYYGHSMIVGPAGNIMALAAAQEDIISAELDPKMIRQTFPGSPARRVYDHLTDLNPRLK